jgi:hypothetical protein
MPHFSSDLILGANTGECKMSEITRRGAAAAAIAVGAAVLLPGKSSAGDSQKAEDLKDGEAKLRVRMATKRWIHISGYATLDALANFVNLSPAQQAGEVVVIPVAGKFDALIYI